MLLRVNPLMERGPGKRKSAGYATDSERRERVNDGGPVIPASLAPSLLADNPDKCGSLFARRRSNDSFQ